MPRKKVYKTTLEEVKDKTAEEPRLNHMEEVGKTLRKRSASTTGHEWSILSRYLDNQSEEFIGEELGLSPKAIKDFIGKTVKALNQSYETKKLVSSQALDKMGKRYSWAPTKALDSQINRKFVSLLSEGDSPVLSEEELHFSYLLVYEGDQKAALKDSGLAVGLSKTLGMAEYNRLLELRCTYLKSKPNIIEHLKELQIKFIEGTKVSKNSIQAEIMRTITQLRNQDDPRNAPTIAKLINDLGRTEGVFIDKSETNHLFSMDDSFELMQQRRKELIASQPESLELELSSSGTYVCPEENTDEAGEAYEQ